MNQEQARNFIRQTLTQSFDKTRFRNFVLVGEGESCHTAQTRFLDLLQDTDQNPTLTKLEEAFSVEASRKSSSRNTQSCLKNLRRP
jgi:hypothetical protein